MSFFAATLGATFVAGGIGAFFFFVCWERAPGMMSQEWSMSSSIWLPRCRRPRCPPPRQAPSSSWTRRRRLPSSRRSEAAFAPSARPSLRHLRQGAGRVPFASSPGCGVAPSRTPPGVASPSPRSAGMVLLPVPGVSVPRLGGSASSRTPPSGRASPSSGAPSPFCRLPPALRPPPPCCCLGDGREGRHRLWPILA